MKPSKSLAILALFATLSACAGGPAPAVEVREVEVPVPVACVSEERLAEATAAEPATLGDIPADANAALPLVTAKALEWKAYALDAMAIVRGCAVRP